MFVMGAAEGTPRIYGPSEKQYCFSCKAESAFMLLKVKRKGGSLLLMFMPPKYNYYLLCPKCGNRFEITSEQFRRYLAKVKRD